VAISEERVRLGLSAGYVECGLYTLWITTCDLDLPLENVNEETNPERRMKRRVRLPSINILLLKHFF